jgi:hypothetical protein
MAPLSTYRSFFVAGVIFLLLVQLCVVVLGAPGGLAGRVDFRVLYAAGHMVRTGDDHQLYNYDKTVATESELAGETGATFAFVHPAYEALLFVPLSFLSYKSAYIVFFFCNIGLILIVFRYLSNSGPRFYLLTFDRRPRVHFSAAGKRFRCWVDSRTWGCSGSRLCFQSRCACALRRCRVLAGFTVALSGVVGLSAAVAGPSFLLSYPSYVMSLDKGLNLEAQPIAARNLASRNAKSAWTVVCAAPWQSQ